MKRFVITLLLLAWGGCIPAHANSYLEMITTKPETHIDETSTVKSTPEIDATIQENRPISWHDTRIKTAAPVVTSAYPKYQAWLQAKANEFQYDDTTEEIQNMIYMLETGLLGWGLYEIYRYK